MTRLLLLLLLCVAGCDTLIQKREAAKVADPQPLPPAPAPVVRPPAPVPAPAPAPPPLPVFPIVVNPALEPLTIKVIPPIDVVKGDPVRAYADVTGPVLRIQWEVYPPTNDIQITPEVSDNGRRLWFTSSTPGPYRVVGIAVGVGVAVTDTKIVAIVKGQDDSPMDTPPPDVVQPTPPPQPQPQPQPVQPPQQQQPSMAQIVVSLVAQVPTQTRVAEAHSLSGVFRETASRIQTGGAPNGADPIAEVQSGANIAIGASAPYWSNFFSSLRSILFGQQQQGVQLTTANVSAWLLDVADTLAKIN